MYKKWVKMRKEKESLLRGKGEEELKEWVKHLGIKGSGGSWWRC